MHLFALSERTKMIATKYTRNRDIFKEGDGGERKKLTAYKIDRK